MTQRILPTLLIVSGTAAVLAMGSIAQSALKKGPADKLPPPPQTAQKQPRIDVVFVLDTTGSMGGLLEGAKQKIWSIADRLVSGQPRPDVRIGLVGYRDRGDAYVTKVTPLSRDIDDVHEALLSFQPQGGGDGPEDVNAALAVALHQQPWEQGQDTLRLVFLVGDAPPHDDYDGPKSWELAASAKEAGITINTLRCGHMARTEQAWKKIAMDGGGEYHSISQDGGVIVEHTPYDEELSKLNRDLADTVIAYGDDDARARSTRKMSTRGALLGAAGASAAAFNAKAGRMNKEDLLTQVDSGEAKMGKLEEKYLPKSLRKLSPEERKAKILAAKKKRKAVKDQILSLSAKREAYIAETKKKGAKESELDDRLMKSVAKQAASIDVAY